MFPSIIINLVKVYSNNFYVTQQQNALFPAVECMNIPIISYLIKNGINVNQFGLVKTTKRSFENQTITVRFGEAELDQRRKAHIIDFAIYLWIAEKGTLLGRERREVVKYLVSLNNTNIRNYVHTNLNKHLLHIRRDLCHFGSYTIMAAFKDMQIDPLTFNDMIFTDIRSRICCFQ